MPRHAYITLQYDNYGIAQEVLEKTIEDVLSLYGYVDEDELLTRLQEIGRTHGYKGERPAFQYPPMDKWGEAYITGYWIGVEEYDDVCSLLRAS